MTVWCMHSFVVILFVDVVNKREKKKRLCLLFSFAMIQNTFRKCIGMV